ncbi:hypothetical protein EX30DRAFT_395829, partial [Ascodesmis nigricans]
MGSIHPHSGHSAPIPMHSSSSHVRRVSSSSHHAAISSSPYADSPPVAASAAFHTPVQQSAFTSSHYYRPPRSTLSSPARSSYTSPSNSPTRAARRSRIQALLATDPLLARLTPVTIRQLSDDQSLGFTQSEREWSLRAADGITKVGEWLREVEGWNAAWGRGKDGEGYLPPEPGVKKKRRRLSRSGMRPIKEEAEDNPKEPMRRKLFEDVDSLAPPKAESGDDKDDDEASKPKEVVVKSYGKPIAPYQLKLMRKSSHEPIRETTEDHVAVVKRKPSRSEEPVQPSPEEFSEEEEEEEDYSEDEEYYGSLPLSTIEKYETRIQEIRAGIDALDVEGLKGTVLAYRTGIDNSLTSSSAIITATTLQLLPPLHRVTKLLTIWAVRLAVLRIVPVFLRWLSVAQVALESGEAAIRHPSLLSGKQKLTEDVFALMSETIQQKIATAGRIMDNMLDALEGREDVLPDKWIGELEDIEEGYSRWEMDAERVVLEGRLRESSRQEDVRNERNRRELEQEQLRLAQEAQNDEGTVGGVLEKAGEVERGLIETMEAHEDLEDKISIEGDDDDDTAISSNVEPVGLGIIAGISESADIHHEERGRRWDRDLPITAIRTADALRLQHEFSPIGSPDVEARRWKEEAEDAEEENTRKEFETQHQSEEQQSERDGSMGSTVPTESGGKSGVPEVDREVGDGEGKRQHEDILRQEPSVMEDAVVTEEQDLSHHAREQEDIAGDTVPTIPLVEPQRSPVDLSQKTTTELPAPESTPQLDCPDVSRTSPPSLSPYDVTPPSAPPLQQSTNSFQSTTIAFSSSPKPTPQSTIVTPSSPPPSASKPIQPPPAITPEIPSLDGAYHSLFDAEEIELKDQQPDLITEVIQHGIETNRGRTAEEMERERKWREMEMEREGEVNRQVREDTGKSRPNPVVGRGVAGTAIVEDGEGEEREVLKEDLPVQQIVRRDDGHATDVAPHPQEIAPLPSASSTTDITKNKPTDPTTPTTPKTPKTPTPPASTPKKTETLTTTIIPSTLPPHLTTTYTPHNEAPQQIPTTPTRNRLPSEAAITRTATRGILPKQVDDLVALPSVGYSKVEEPAVEEEKKKGVEKEKTVVGKEQSTLTEHLVQKSVGRGIPTTTEGGEKKEKNIATPTTAAAISTAIPPPVSNSATPTPPSKATVTAVTPTIPQIFKAADVEPPINITTAVDSNDDTPLVENSSAATLQTDVENISAPMVYAEYDATGGAEDHGDATPSLSGSESTLLVKGTPSSPSSSLRSSATATATGSITADTPELTALSEDEDQAQPPRGSSVDDNVTATASEDSHIKVTDNHIQDAEIVDSEDMSEPAAAPATIPLGALSDIKEDLKTEVEEEDVKEEKNIIAIEVVDTPLITAAPGAEAGSEPAPESAPEPQPEPPSAIPNPPHPQQQRPPAPVSSAVPALITSSPSPSPAEPEPELEPKSATENVEPVNRAEVDVEPALVMPTRIGQGLGVGLGLGLGLGIDVDAGYDAVSTVLVVEKDIPAAEVQEEKQHVDESDATPDRAEVDEPALVTPRIVQGVGLGIDFPLQNTVAPVAAEEKDSTATGVPGRKQHVDESDAAPAKTTTEDEKVAASSADVDVHVVEIKARESGLENVATPGMEVLSATGDDEITLVDSIPTIEAVSDEGMAEEQETREAVDLGELGGQMTLEVGAALDGNASPEKELVRVLGGPMVAGVEVIAEEEVTVGVESEVLPRVEINSGDGELVTTSNALDLKHPTRVPELGHRGLTTIEDESKGIDVESTPRASDIKDKGDDNKRMSMITEESPFDLEIPPVEITAHNATHPFQPDALGIFHHHHDPESVPDLSQKPQRVLETIVEVHSPIKEIAIPSFDFESDTESQIRFPRSEIGESETTPSTPTEMRVGAEDVYESPERRGQNTASSSPYTEMDSLEAAMKAVEEELKLPLAHRPCSSHGHLEGARGETHDVEVDYTPGAARDRSFDEPVSWNEVNESFTLPDDEPNHPLDDNFDYGDFDIPPLTTTSTPALPRPTARLSTGKTSELPVITEALTPQIRRFEMGYDLDTPQWDSDAPDVSSNKDVTPDKSVTPFLKSRFAVMGHGGDGSVKYKAKQKKPMLEGLFQKAGDSGGGKGKGKEKATVTPNAIPTPSAAAGRKIQPPGFAMKAKTPPGLLLVKDEVSPDEKTPDKEVFPERKISVMKRPAKRSMIPMKTPVTPVEENAQGRQVAERQSVERPASRNERPVSRLERPQSRSEGMRSTSRNNERPPSRTYERPPSRIARPPSRTEAPASRGDRSASRTERPPSRIARPASRTETPTTRVDRSASRTERPPSRIARPASRTERPPSRIESSANRASSTRASSISTPPKRQEAPVTPRKPINLDDRVNDLLMSLPRKVKLTASNLQKLDDQSGPVTSSGSRIPKTPSDNGSVGSAAPTISIHPTTGRSRNSGQGDIKCYHLHRNDDQPPMKLFVRLVGDARLVCRVGGGWSDLEEYLKEWALHHGSKMRAVSESRLQIADLPGPAAAPQPSRTLRPSISNGSLATSAAARHRASTSAGFYRSTSPIPMNSYSRPVSPCPTYAQQRSTSPSPISRSRVRPPIQLRPPSTDPIPFRTNTSSTI